MRSLGDLNNNKYFICAEIGISINVIIFIAELAYFSYL